MRHVAREGAQRGIRVNMVCPGLVDTPLGRHTREIAYSVLFFISDESVYVTAQTLAVDGGITGI
jgi:NAD(P)-dependent dehydrogenase (short-subunit alcohol dehydrogenase family)